MRRLVAAAVVGVVAVGMCAVVAAAEQNVRRLPVSEYCDKMKAGWIGQMAGVGWGGPTEFKSRGKIMPGSVIPKWHPNMINQFGQDDIYVEMTFLRSMEEHGLDVSLRQAGIDFANSKYALWHANNEGRSNLRKGIAPPDSGHPQFNKHADDIDYQIESDFSGLIAPGLPNVAIEMGEKFGRLMNYGDGIYGGQFFGGMYAEAFFETDPVKIVEAGLRCIPDKSQYAETINDLLKWYKQNPDDWEKTWELIDQKYQQNPNYRKASCDKGAFNIDAKINGAYVVMGVLYGKRDPEKTIVISTRCGQDSDCNPSSAAGVLFTTIGFAKLPEEFKSGLDEKGVFSNTAYNFPKLAAVCEKLARQGVVKWGGRIEKDADGKEVFVIPTVPPKPSKLEQCWEPGPIANSRFTDEEMAKITEGKPKLKAEMNKLMEKLAPGWTVANCGSEMDPGLKEDLEGKKNVLVTHPLDRDTPCVLSKKVEVPAGKKTSLKLVVGHHPEGDWTLVVKADGKELLNKSIGKDIAPNCWWETSVDLSGSAGKTIALELHNRPSGWSWEAAYWAEISLKSE